jgi:hypothetical protein
MMTDLAAMIAHLLEKHKGTEYARRLAEVADELKEAIAELPKLPPCDHTYFCIKCGQMHTRTQP